MSCTFDYAKWREKITNTGENQMSKNIRKVVILGGGTAGWMTAAILSKSLSQLDITLIESEQIGTIGVGEATIPSLHFFNDMLGINSSEFTKQTSGTFKLGIQFEGWHKKNEKYFTAQRLLFFVLFLFVSCVCACVRV